MKHATIPSATPGNTFNFTTAVTEAIQGLGARHVSGYAWELDTRAGLLGICICEDWLACWFDDIERALEVVTFGVLNPDSGRWDWHFDPPGGKGVEFFRSRIEWLQRGDERCGIEE